jgi:hypothetical protein
MINVDIMEGNRSELKKTVCDLLVSFLKIRLKDKKIINLSYSKISKNVSNVKTKEKKAITDFLQMLGKDDRMIETNFKKYKLGRWNMGTQKGIFQYDKDVYDKNHKQNLAEMYGEIDAIEDNFIENNNQRLEYDYEDIERANEEAYLENDDLYGLENVHDNFMDGVYYDSDNEDDDF